MRDTNYQIGDYTLFNNKEVCKVSSVSEYHLDLINKDNVPFFGVHYSLVEPLTINLEFLEAAGFKQIMKRRYMLHDKYAYHLKLNNGKTFYLMGVVYTKGSVWMSRGYTINSFHQLQSLVKHNDYTKKLIMF